MRIEILSSLRNVAPLDLGIHSELSGHQGLYCVALDVCFTNILGFEGIQGHLKDICQQW